MTIFMLLTSLLPFVGGVNIVVDWTFPTSSATSLPSRTAFVGDTIIFNWMGTHDVFIHNAKTCSTTDRVLVGRSSGVKYTFTKADIGDIVFACDVDNHCSLGMILTVTVKDPSVVDWFIPVGSDSLPPKSVTVGDTISFKWTGNHNVYIHPSGSCSETGKILVGTTSGTRYTFKKTDPSKMLFVCDVGDHCEQGLKLGIDVKPFGSICFSGNSRVHVESKGHMTMSALQIGDRVLVNGNKYEPVYSFGHRDESGYGEFLEVHSNGTSGDPLHISHSHMILLRGKHWVPASAIRVGDTLSSSNGEFVAVTMIRNVTRKGTYAPFTTSGTIVVNDIVASSFISFQGSEYLKLGDIVTPFTYQWLGHTFESGHRFVCINGLLDCSEEAYTALGVSQWVYVPHLFARWFVEQPVVVSCVVFVPLLLLFWGFVLLLEHPMWVCTVLGAVMVAVRAARSINRKAVA